KASGPDLLGNGWYREYAEILAPLLTTLLTLWYEAGVFPSSFLEADIFCLKKGGDQDNPLNYRPLALLNTDYKVFTRVLATRVSKTLGDLIHTNQNRFVPHRHIHETIDLLTAAQLMARIDPGQRDALALLLDFQKAYDSLDRHFLLDVLARQGFSPRFIQAVVAIHNGTTVRFLANGAKSRRIQVTSGIRQGCPLAPLLFILALDPLYRRLDQAADIRGIRIRTASHSFVLHVAGYADDTAVYLRCSTSTRRKR
ncbi:Reverse transcriptase precursor, partial [Phytophthora megakarya]